MGCNNEQDNVINKKNKNCKRQKVMFTPFSKRHGGLPHGPWISEGNGRELYALAISFIPIRIVVSHVFAPGTVRE